MGNTISIRVNNSNDNINQKQTSIHSTLNISANCLLTQFTIYNLVLEDVATFKMVCKLANFKKVACPKIVNLKY